MKTSGLFKLAEELEDRYWAELYENFKVEADKIYENSAINPYIYDNYYEETPEFYSLELTIGTGPEDHSSFTGKPDISHADLLKQILALGKAFQSRFPKAKFLLKDEPSDGSHAIIKSFTITVSKSDIKVAK